jgi:SpoVK/Ycf46/Vps4 family AAA+-type ATPase
MQERPGQAFVIATANDIEGLPPELLRKGRFDEVWWIDLPTPAEREAIMTTALRSHGRGNVKIDLPLIAQWTETFTGSEIAALVPDALFAAFGDGSKPREIKTDDLLKAAQNVVPLSKTAAEKIARLRTWASSRARPATSAETVKQSARASSRALDL